MLISVFDPHAEMQCFPPLFEVWIPTKRRAGSPDPTGPQPLDLRLTSKERSSIDSKTHRPMSVLNQKITFDKIVIN